MPAFSSANCRTTKLATQFTKAVLGEMILCGCCSRIVCLDHKSAVKLHVGYLRAFQCKYRFLFLSFFEFHFPSSVSLFFFFSLSFWIHEILTIAKQGIPHSRLWETDFKCVLNTDCAAVLSLNFSFSHVEANKQSCQAPRVLQLLVYFSFYATNIYWIWFFLN